MEQDRPPVTVTDPNHHLPEGDLLLAGAERDPWRPRRWQVLTVVGAVLATVVTASVVQRIRADREDARLDRLSVAEIVLGLTTFQLDPTHEAPEGTITVGFRNDGPAALRLLSVDFRTPGLGVVHPDAALPQYGIYNLDVPVGAPCPPSTGPDTVAEELTHATVGVRTSRGVEHGVQVPVPGDISEALLKAMRRKCGLLLPQEAVTIDVPPLRARGWRTTITATVVVRGARPVLLTHIAALPGFRLTTDPALPLRLEAATDSELALTIEVLDCEQLEGSRYTGSVEVGRARVTDVDGRREGVVLISVSGDPDDPATFDVDPFPDCFPGPPPGPFH